MPMYKAAAGASITGKPAGMRTYLTPCRPSACMQEGELALQIVFSHKATKSQVVPCSCLVLRGTITTELHSQPLSCLSTKANVQGSMKKKSEEPSFANVDDLLVSIWQVQR